MPFARRTLMPSALLAIALAPAAFAAPGHGSGQGHTESAAPQSVDRTVEIEAAGMSFLPGEVTVRPGETIRFVVTNTTDVEHEFAVDTPSHHAAHREEMREMMQGGMSMAEMMHDDPNVVSLPPGATKELVVTIEHPSEVTMACNLPGHFESGMRGDFVATEPAQGS